MIDSIFPDNSPLRVRRVRSYRVPRYPDHHDPDPTTTPQPVPYPWKSGVAAALLALGETSCDRGKKEQGASTQPPQGPPLPPPAERVIFPDTEKEIDQIVAEALRETPKGDQNPFAQAFGFSGLPHVSSSFGTGAPTPLDSVLAQKLIARLFAAESLKSQPTTFTENDFTATAQGYDPEKRIGYVMGDEKNLGEGTIKSWTTENIFEIAAGKVTAATPKEVADLKKDLDRGAHYLFDGRTLDAADTQHLADIAKIESPQESAKAYLALAAKLDEPKLSMTEIEHAEKMAEAHQRYLAIISIVDKRFESFDRAGSEYGKLNYAMYQEAEHRQFATQEERWAWIAKQQESINLKTQHEQLTKLAQSVREYIAWARRNGLQ